MDVKQFLKGVPAFDNLQDEDLDRLVKLGQLRKVKAGEKIDGQGEPASRYYILVRGRIAVVLDLDFGVSKKSYMVTTIGANQMFAWSGMVGNPTYTAGGKALTDSEVLEFDVALLEREFEEDPRLGYAVMRGVAKTIASRLRKLQLQLVQQYAMRETAE
jgi:CRP-like cAMP-binding protein